MRAKRQPYKYHHRVDVRPRTLDVLVDEASMDAHGVVLAMATDESLCGAAYENDAVAVVCGRRFVYFAHTGSECRAWEENLSPGRYARCSVRLSRAACPRVNACP